MWSPLFYRQQHLLGSASTVISLGVLLHTLAELGSAMLGVGAAPSCGGPDVVGVQMRKLFVLTMLGLMPLSMAGCVTPDAGAVQADKMAAEGKRMSFMECYNEANRRAPEPKGTLQSQLFVNSFARHCAVNGWFPPEESKKPR